MTTMSSRRPAQSGAGSHKEEERMRFALLGLGLLSAVMLFSCLGIENTYTINENGGGRLAFQYRVSQMFRNLDKTEGDAAVKNAPLPISEADLRQSFSKIDGVTVLAVKQWEDETDIYVKGEIEFKTVAALNKSEALGDMPVSLVKEGAVTTFIQVLCEKREPLDAATLEAYRGLFEGYAMTFRINAPRPIVAANHGELSADKRTLTYTISLIDFVRITEKTEWRVSY
jgi:hypothetical protein